MDVRDRRKNTIADIYVNLPCKDCGVSKPPSPCGLNKCVMFAEALLDGERNVHDCPFMNKEQRGSIGLVLDEYFR
ncbi:MAG: hypothetical protein NTU61_00645 [Candidatus Altiarchaeota archaeon]|nr:hypothetical protein [Candidatus Altiarchaeota archaeon]